MFIAKSNCGQNSKVEIVKEVEQKASAKVLSAFMNMQGRTEGASTPYKQSGQSGVLQSYTGHIVSELRLSPLTDQGGLDVK